MSKNKPKVSFYGKDMNLLRAKLFSYELRMGLVGITLTEEDLESYSKWKNIRENRNALSRKLIKEETYKNLKEKDYLVESLENQIKYVRNEISNLKIKSKNVKYCEKHGHTEKKGSDYCAKCGVTYKENPCGPTINPFRS